MRSKLSRSSRGAALYSARSRNYFVAEFCEVLFEQNTQLIVVIDDENPAFYPSSSYRYRIVRGELPRET
jgi:hypothetical protein